MATDENDRRLAAPGELELVRDFVNTRDLGKGTDRIDSPEALSSWLARRGLVPDPPEATEDDATRVRSLREALRAMLVANAGFPLDPGAVDAFNDAARAAHLGVQAGDAGRVALVPASGGLDQAISRLLSAVFAAQENGTWPRLKACGECHWALYDRTKNRSAAWCDPAKCGARVRSRRYRERRRGTPA
jgi:predicted RNA-binding Zn ribbon-like protein